MKLLSPLFLLAAGSVASAQVRADEYARTYGFQWAVGGQNAGTPKSWEGGDFRATVVEEGSKRRPGAARHEDVRCTSLARLEPVVLEWLQGALDGAAPARDVRLVELKRDGSLATATQYAASKITEFVVPALDHEALDVESIVTIKFAPGSVQALTQAPVFAAAPGGKGVKAFTNEFKLTVDGLDAQDVIKISEITVRIRPGSPPQVSNLVLSMLEHPASFPAWKAWFDSFVVQGNNGDAHEKNGTLTLGSSGALPVLSLGLKGLGIVRLSSRRQAVGNVASAVRHDIELYAEGASIRTEGAATPIAAPTAAERPAPERAAGDQGNRDPEGVPRFPECVRTSFTATRSKIANDERADYVARAAPDKVEAWAVEEMRRLEWKDGARSESGSAKDGSYRIDVRWVREKQTAKLVVGMAKDGSTTLSWHVVTTR